MKMNLRSTFILTAVALMAVATPITFIARADHDDTPSAPDSPAVDS